MKKQILTLLIFFSVLLISSCSKTPPSSLVKEQYRIINQNVKTILGESYEAQNFVVVEEGYENEQKNKYIIKITFDLNKPVFIHDGKKIPAVLLFEKNLDNEWECTFNSANIKDLFNLLK